MANCERAQLTLDSQLVGVFSGENSLFTRFTRAHTHTHTHTHLTSRVKFTRSDYIPVGLSVHVRPVAGYRLY